MVIDVSVTFPYADTNPLYVQFTDNSPQVDTTLRFDHAIGRWVNDIYWVYHSAEPRTIPIRRTKNSDGSILETGSVNIVFPSAPGIERIVNGLLDETNAAIFDQVTLTGWTLTRLNTTYWKQGPKIDNFVTWNEICAALYCPGDSMSQNIDLTDVSKIKFEVGGQFGPESGGIIRSDISLLIDGVVIFTVNTTGIDRETKPHMQEVPVQYTGVHKVEFAITEGSPTDTTKIGPRFIRHLSARTDHSQLVADFSATPLTGLEVQFTDLSTEDPTAWKWDFGEDESVMQNPIHVYQAPGTYNVTLTATNPINSDDETKVIPVTVAIPPKPEVAFTSSVPVPATPLSIQFTDQSTEDPSSWFWEFGDGSNSTEQNPLHLYVNYGSYSVKLTATNGNGSATLTKTVTINPPPPSGAASPSTVQVNTTTRITLTGTGFKSGSKVRITCPILIGIVSKIISISSTQIVFDFYFESYFIGICGISVYPPSGTPKVFPNAILVQ